MKRTEPRRGAGSVRIIGGRLRGSRLPVADLPGLRPTSDRVRETLFNWLAPVLPEASVLDLFAGTGALGFEAGSRGARQVVMVERDPGLAAQLAGAAQRLGVSQARVVVGDAIAWLRAASELRFDVVFLDPPFGSDLLAAAIDMLAPHLAEDARVYVECAREAADPVPSHWERLRGGETRDVRYTLYRVRARAA